MEGVQSSMMEYTGVLNTKINASCEQRFSGYLFKNLTMLQSACTKEYMYSKGEHGADVRVVHA
jgi:hypothetical protein